MSDYFIYGSGRTGTSDYDGYSIRDPETKEDCHGNSEGLQHSHFFLHRPLLH